MPRKPIKNEKAKDFRGTILRLFKELKSFRVLIFIGLLLAGLGSILSIMAPNKLSDLIDKISEGLVVNTKNLEIITENAKSSFNEDKIKNIIPNILSINISEDNITSIMSSNSITVEDKQKFQDFLSSNNNENDMLNRLNNLPTSILNIILNESKYNDVTITVDDKIQLLNIISQMNGVKNLNIPDSIASIIFSEIKIDDITITPVELGKFISIMSSIDENASSTLIYSKIDEMPESIRKAVEPVFDVNGIKSIVIFLITLYILSAIFSYIESISMTVVSNNFAKILRSRISNKINKLPLKYFDKNQTGDILSRVTNDVDTVAQSMNQSFATLVCAITLFIGTVIMMFVTNYIMAITAILSSLIGFIFMFKVLSKSQKYFVQRQKYLGQINAHIEEIYSGLNVVKVYNGKKQANEKFDVLNEKVYNANRKSQFLSGLMMPMMNFIGNFGYVAVCIVGALLTMNGHITFGVIVAFMTYVRLFTSPLSQIGQAMTSLQTTAAASERVFEFLDEAEMSKQDKIIKKLDKSKAKGNIEFQNVEFTYDGNNLPTIKNFSAKVKAGKKIAIVGPTGAGKTTMVNLLMKFYEINKGDIKIDGISINELSRENIHELFTMVLQDTWLFDGTVKENIVYNRENIPLEKVEEVCEIVGLDHFIKTLPHGYNSKISESDSISSGQRQLLTIARGMIEDSPFLILDEATSNVDTRTEELVQKAMDKLTEGRTSFIIAHRLSTIKNADLILVMKDGNIIEQGTHNELMKKNGFYADLYNSQFEL